MTALSDQLSSAWSRRSPPSFIWLIGILVAALMAIPLIYLLIRAGQADADAWRDLTRSSTLRLLRNTVLMALAVTGGSAALALPMAWLTSRTDLPLRRFWSVVTVLPLVVPSYVGALAFVAALGPRGTLQQALAPLGVDALPDLRGFGGAWLVLTLFTYPYLLLVLRAGLRSMDPAMEEASRALGVGPWRTFWRVVVPQLRVPLAAGSLLVALYVLSDFGAVSILRFDTFTRAIFIQFQSSFDRAAGAVLSLILVALVVVVLGLEASIRARGRYHALGATQRRSRVVPLGRWGWPSVFFLALIALISLGLPVAVLSEWLTRGSDGSDAFRGAWTAAWHSLSVSAVAGLVALAASIPIAILAVRHRSVWSLLIERISYFGFALPGIVVALALVFFSLRVIPGLYQTWFVLVFAYVVLFLPASIGAVRSALVRIKPNMEEAARGLGHSPTWVTATVTLPLVAPGLIGGFAIVFLTTMKELPATLLLAPIEYDTLAAEVWRAADEAFFAQAAAPALLLIGLAAVPMALIVGRENLRD